jgi:hypothetical protein
MPEHKGPHERDCPDCGHDRRQHDGFTGCTELLDYNTGKTCPCKRKFMEI